MYLKPIFQEPSGHLASQSQFFQKRQRSAVNEHELLIYQHFPSNYSQFPVESVGSVRTAFQISGNGPALLLLHGAEANRLSFNALSAHLIDHFTLITYDQRDCGET